MNCAICQPGTTERIFLKHGHWIRQCRCGHRFAELQAHDGHVGEVYGDAYFTEGGDGYPDYVGERRIISNQGRFYGRLLKQHIKQPGTVLDIGAAAGFILEGLQDYGWKGIGIEPNASMAAHAQGRGIDVRVGTLEDFTPGQQFNLVSMVQVIAHFYDIRKALRVARDVTAYKGHWLIETWNKDSWMARMQKDGWHEYSPPSVLHYFSLDGLETLAKQFGMRLVAHGRPPKKISAHHVKSLVGYKLNGSALGGAFSTMAKIVPDSLTVPYPSFDLAWMLFQSVD